MILNGPDLGSDAVRARDLGDKSGGQFSPHERMTIELIEETNAGQLLDALKREFKDRFPGETVPTDATGFVRFFSRRDKSDVYPLFRLVRRALQAQKATVTNLETRQVSEKAAAMLYCLAAFLVVDREAVEAGRNGYVLAVPYAKKITCAVIATALFGGVLQLGHPDSSDLSDRSEHLRLLRPEWILDADVSDNGDSDLPSLECAAYAAIFRNRKDVPDVRHASELTPQQRADLVSYLGDLKDQKLSIALVIRGEASPEAAAAVASSLELPMLLPSREVAAMLFGMSEESFLAEVGRLWEMFDAFSGTGQPDSPTTHSPDSGGSPMAASHITVNLNGDHATIAVAPGDHATANAHVSHSQGADISALLPLLQAIQVEIAALSSEKARNSLGGHVAVAQAEAGKGNASNPGLIKATLDTVKSAADALDGSDKIVAAVVRACTFLGPLLPI